MALPNDKLSIPMIARDLGTNNNNLGDLCTHENINIWSKNKPVRYNSVEGLTPEQMRRQSQHDTYYGIYIENASTPITLRSIIFGLTNTTHEYRRPRGLAYNEAYRDADFRSYQRDGGGLVTTTGASALFGQEKRVNVGGAFDNPPKDVFMAYGGIEPMETTYLVAKQDVYPESVVYRGIMLTFDGQSYYKTGEVNWNDPILKAWFTRGVTNITVDAMEFMTNIKQDSLRNATNIPGGAIFYAVLKDRNIPFTNNPYSIIASKTLAPGTLRYKEPPFIGGVYNAFNNRINYSVTFDASVPEAGGGVLKNPRIILIRSSDDRWIEIQNLGVGDYNLSNNEVKVFNGYFEKPFLGMELMVIERGNIRARTSIIQEA